MDDDMTGDTTGGFEPLDEEAFLATLREALREPETVPRQVVENGYAAFAWRTVDAELAELLYDSATEPFAAGARSEVTSDRATARAMTFASDQATIELERTDDKVLGQISPALSAEVLVIVEGKVTLRRPVDDLGRFRLEPVPDGPFRLRFDGTTSSVITGPISFA